MSFSIGPGAMTFALIPNRPVSLASDLVNPMMPPLAAE
jgi:hypothetical protein